MHHLWCATLDVLMFAFVVDRCSIVTPPMCCFLKRGQRHKQSRNWMQMKTSITFHPCSKFCLSQYLCKVFQLVEHAISALYPPILVQFLRANQWKAGLREAEPSNWLFGTVYRTSWEGHTARSTQRLPDRLYSGHIRAQAGGSSQQKDVSST